MRWRRRSCQCTVTDCRSATGSSSGTIAAPSIGPSSPDGRARLTTFGFGQPVTNLEIVRSLLRLLQRSEDLIEFVQDRPGHDRRYALDTTKISSELGWQPAVGLKEGLQYTVDWYRAHSGWMQRVRGGDYRSYYETVYTRRDEFLAAL